MNYGEIWQLGRHRLMCGDATKASDIELLVGSEKIDLVLTDPPYGIKIQNKDGSIGGAGASSWLRRKSDFKKVINYSKFQGDETTESARKNYEILRDIVSNFIIWGGNYFTDFLPPSGGWIFWDKQKPDGLYFGSGELAYNTCSRVIRKYEHKSNGFIIEGSRDLNPIPRLHPTQKPVELHMKILEDFSKEGDTILDCFGGSGTTLIACEVTNRNCLMMEISPEYCEIIKSRWEKLNPLFNQNKAERIA